MDDLNSNIAAKLSKPITLVGMMGAGKSHLGAQLSQTLGLSFFDSDKIIEEKAGQSVADIFDNFGEAKFREAEHNTICELLAGGPSIIATGGGALMNAQTLERLKAQSIVVWLDADLETIWGRVQKSNTRPLLQTENPKEKIESLLEQRRSLYEQAHIHFDAGQEQTEADALIKALYEFLNADKF